jgi:hypothetical protein
MHSAPRSPHRPCWRKACFFLLAVFSNAHAVTLTDGPATTPTDRGVIITWKTDVESGSRVNYGTRPDFLDKRADGGVSAVHTVTIEGLEPGTVYHYAVGSARQRLASGTFTTTGKGASRPLPKLNDSPVPNKSPPVTSKPVPVPLKAPPTKATWGNLYSLRDHYERHGADFQSKSPDDYAAKAWQFLQRAKMEALPIKYDEVDGTIRVWDGKTRSFAAYNRDGTTKTFFKPESPTYWSRQPGRPIKPSQLPFK